MKKIVSIKTVIAFFAFIFLCIPFTFVLSACGGNANTFDINGSVINNFANYSYIGSAYVNNQSNTTVACCNLNVASSNINLSPTSNNRKIKLVGKNKTGNFEEIKFSKDGALTEQTWEVGNILTAGRFMFVKYVSDLNQFTPDGNDRLFISNSENIKTYVIDTKTGKVYFTDNMTPQITSLYVNNLFYYDDVVYISYGRNFDNYDLYKLFIENGNLVLKKLVDKSSLNFIQYNIKVDCYGNAYLKSDNNTEKYNYVITNNEQLKVINNIKLTQSVNGVIYCGDQKFDNNANLVSKSENEKFLSIDYNLAYEKDNIRYYLKDNSFIKTIWDNNNNFTTEVIPFEKQNKGFAYTSNRIYILEQESICFYDVNLGTYTDVVSDYVFNSISKGYNNDIIFKALTSSLQIVNGTIADDGTINIEINNNGFDIIYMQPLI